MRRAAAPAMRAALLIAGLLALPAPMARAGDAAGAAERGRQTFQRQCATCHGQGPGDDGAPHLPGTAALERKYGGAQPGALERRTDLDAAIIRLFVRNGSGAMPMFRKTELSDADIDDIAAHLRASASAGARRRR